jgi:hypothetical protein
VKIVREALQKRHSLSRTRGRLGTPAEVVLRLMALNQDDCRNRFGWRTAY